MSRQERIAQGIAAWAGFYRCNPHRFARDFLNLDLHLFQKIVLIMMNRSSTVTFIGARGIGKSFLTAIFCVVRCILWPGTKICLASGTRGQGVIVLEKILLELKPNSQLLAMEIDEKNTKLNSTNAQIIFKNSSFIKVVTAGDSARGNRCNVLAIDEYRLVSKDVIDTVLRKFMAQKRRPAYSALDKKEREIEYAKELNQTMYLSSAYYTDHWSYTKCLDTCRFMLDDTRKQFVCGLPYQLSIKEGLLDEDAVLDEMAESDFNEIKFMMEYEARWYGDDDGSFFDFTSVSKNRRLKYPMLPDKLASKLNNDKRISIIPKQNGEKRILSADIALMSSKRNNNDASAIFINQLIPNKSGRYTNNIIYCDSSEGLHTNDQSLMIRRLYEEFQCDYIVIDTVGVGLGCFDALVREMVDPETGEIYPALSCCNNQEMADRCADRTAEKVIWAIKGNASLNSDCAVLLREGFKTGKIRLLMTELDAERMLGEIKGFNSLSETDRAKLQMPYINTTLLINELVKLQHEETSGKVRVYEKSGMRKDRYSSLSYNYYVATMLESKLKKRRDTDEDQNQFLFRAPKIKSNNGRW